MRCAREARRGILANLISRNGHLGWRSWLRAHCIVFPSTTSHDVWGFCIAAERLGTVCKGWLVKHEIER